MKNARWLSCSFSAAAFLSLSITGSCAADLIANPTFKDGDGDGKPDGWELKSLRADAPVAWAIEKYKKDKTCLSMKVPRKDKSSFTGEVSTVFSGPAGFYQVTVSYLDENDGISKAKLLVNGKIVHIWNFDGTFADCWRDEVIENVELNPGDKITLWGKDNPSEYCRVRSLNVVPSPKPPTAKEIEEMRNPPVIGEARLGPLVALAAQRDLSSLEKKPEYAPLVINGYVLFLSKGNENIKFNLKFQPSQKPATYSLLFFGTESTGLEKDKGTVMLDKKGISQAANGEAEIFLKTSEPGLYGLDVQGSNFLVETDVPHVIPVPTDKRNYYIMRAIGTFYFFVPKGVTALGIGAYPNGYIGEVTLRGPDGSLITRMDVLPDSKFGIPVRVRPGQDDQIWSVSIEGVSPAVRVFGVPPYLATHPRYLLIPK